MNIGFWLIPVQPSMSLLKGGIGCDGVHVLDYLLYSLCEIHARKLETRVSGGAVANNFWKFIAKT